MSYRVEFEPRAWDELMELSEKMQRRIFAATDALEENPRPAGVKKLKGEENAWRIRAGDYRIVYEIHDNVLLVRVFNIGNRKEVYRKR